MEVNEQLEGVPRDWSMMILMEREWMIKIKYLKKGATLSLLIFRREYTQRWFIGQ